MFRPFQSFSILIRKIDLLKVKIEHGRLSSLWDFPLPTENPMVKGQERVRELAIGDDQLAIFERTTVDIFTHTWSKKRSFVIWKPVTCQTEGMKDKFNSARSFQGDITQ